MSVVPKLIPWLVAAILIAACSGGGNGGDGTRTATVTSTSSAEPSATGSTLPAERITFYGAEAGDHAGAVIASDFNGDGVQDAAVGAAQADGPDNAREDGGEVYLFLGPFQAGGSLDAGAADYDAVFYGAEAADNLGRALAAGDFNGDNIDDLAMAAPSANGEAGAIYVMLGGDWPAETDFAGADPDVLLRGGAAGDFAGLALATGELGADGRTGLVIGALLADGPQDSRPDAGEVYVVGGDQLVAGNALDLGQAAGVVYGAQPGDRLGEALTTGDVNADGKTDLVIVATFSGGADGARSAAGVTYAIDSPATFPLDLATATPQFEIIGADSGDQLGHSIGAGDTDGDGAADVWVGAVSSDGQGNGENLAGEASLVLGSKTRTGNLDVAAGDVAATIYGPESEARLGRSLALGDLNGDGRADLVISAPNVAGRAGQVFVFFASGSYPTDAAAADLTLTGHTAGDLLGHEAFGQPSLGVADMDGDGRADMLVSAASADGPNGKREDCGEVYLIPGAALAG